MPGIIPMKVINTGFDARSRVAQACDRCRSKKIRCDGVLPCCSHCARARFECKTSDKLTRRAFPRGYTDSLEERVRVLETEVRELKDLVDEKDETIDILSKLYSNRKPPSPRSTPTPSLSSPAVNDTRESTAAVSTDDVFEVQASPLLLDAEGSDPYFMGASSGKNFVDAFKHKLQKCGRSPAGFNPGAFLHAQSRAAPPARTPKSLAASLTHTLNSLTAPPCLFSDRCVNIFFQEWAPLFPVLHRPTFLRTYEEFMSSPGQVTDHYKRAQLYLVFVIAGLSEQEHTALCEDQWRLSLQAILGTDTLQTLQCLILALIHFISKGSYSELQHYKGIAVALSYRLGLHQSQKRFSFGALTTETRKKVFWTLYTIDCFSAALLGLPKLLKEEVIYAEYPSDKDDEYVTERGFQPTLPGEHTKISSALALICVSRILSKVLDQIYPLATTYNLSMQSLTSLEKELDRWSDSLPAHLKLTFVQDKLSTDITGSRSTILSLAYYYIRTLIHRPAIGCSPLSVISLAESSKCIIQIVQLLEERNMTFSFCLNKNEMLILCGLSLLYQGLDLKQQGKLIQDRNHLVAIVGKNLENSKALGAADFQRLTASITNPDSQSSSTSGRTVENTADRPSQQEKPSRVTSATIANLSLESRHRGRMSTDSPRSESGTCNREHRSSTPLTLAVSNAQAGKISKLPNLDYFSLNTTSTSSQSPVSSAYSDPKTTTEPREWEVNLGSLEDRGIYDAIYGPTTASLSAGAACLNDGAWNFDSWEYTTALTGDLNMMTTNGAFSYSGETPGSVEELEVTEVGGHDSFLLGVGDKYPLDISSALNL